MDKRALLATYFRQQAELAMPDAIIDRALIALLVHKPRPEQATYTSSSSRPPIKAVAPGAKKPSFDYKNRLASLRPIGQLIDSASKLPPLPAPSAASVCERKAASAKRAALMELLSAGCTKCPLGATRTKYVFGSGNADASVVIIGEAPGQEEDEQGLPFVGPAGKLLTKMLAAINLDRTNDVFITNVLKCRPPQNRNPSTEEIMACLPLLKRQIDILKPKAILLLGKIAANALLCTNDSIAKMRRHEFSYNGIPAAVTYHPAALLHNAEYKRPAWEDLQRFNELLLRIGVYGSISKK